MTTKGVECKELTDNIFLLFYFKLYSIILQTFLNVDKIIREISIMFFFLSFVLSSFWFVCFFFLSFFLSFFFSVTCNSRTSLSESYMYDWQITATMWSPNKQQVRIKTLCYIYRYGIQGLTNVRVSMYTLLC